MSDSEAPSLDNDTRAIYEQMVLNTAWGYRDLHQAWQRPVRHNRKIERSALWNAVMLHAACVRVLYRGGDRALCPPHTTPAQRYQLQAGIHVVTNILPFNDYEIDVIRGPNPVGEMEFPGQEVIERAPDLVERWHAWVWEGVAVGPERTVQALGGSAVLAEAFDQLYTAVGSALKARPDDATP